MDSTSATTFVSAFDFCFQPDRFVQIVRHDRAIQQRFVRRINQLLLIDHRRQARALHVQQIVIEINLSRFQRRHRAGHDDDQRHQHRPLQPEIFDPRPLFLQMDFVVQHILPPAQQQAPAASSSSARGRPSGRRRK